VVKVAQLQEPAVVTLPPNGESLLFAADDPVLPGLPGSMAFGDHRWDLSILGLAANQVAGNAVLNFDRFLKPLVLGGSQGPSEQIRLSPIWLLRAKEVIAILLVPTRHTSRGQLDIYRVRESSSSKLKTVLAHVYALAVWSTREALPPDLDRWQQDDLNDFIAHLATERTNQRSGAQGLDSISVRGYVNTLRTLHLLRETLTDGGFSFNPWDGMSVEQVTGADISVCRTKPIPAEQYQPLMRNLWKVIDEIVPDLLNALRCTDELNNSPNLAWWGNVNQHVKSGGTSGAEVVLCHGNVAPTLKTFRQVLTDNPGIVFAGAADLERRSGIPVEWFSRNHERLIATGILERTHPPSGQVIRCTVPGCERERLRRTCWCRAHEYRWQQAGRPDPTIWPVTEEAGLPLGPTPLRCAVPLCLRQAKGGQFCGAHVQRWAAAGKPDIETWASGDEAGVPPGGWHYRWTGYFPDALTVADHLGAWLETPDNRIPLRASDQFAVHLKRRRGGSWDGDAVNRDLLAQMIGVRSDTLRAGCRRWISWSTERFRAVKPLSAGCARSPRSAGRTAASGPGSTASTQPCSIRSRTSVGMCCIVFVYMFSGMRDSEVQSLKRGCVEPFWGHLTLTGKEFKTFRGAQARWVVIEPVAHAARLAETLSWHDHRIVVSARPGTDPVIDAGQEIDGIIKTMNVAAELGLLEKIPDGAPIRPHRFRRTFAVTARKYPWMQIALNWQFKHASHFMTQGYYALNDNVTADDNEVGKELVEAAVDRLADLYERHERGEPLYGRAAARVVSEFGAISADVATVEGEGQAGVEGGFDGQTHPTRRSPQATPGIGPAPLSGARPRLCVRAWRCVRRGGGPELERLQSPMRERDPRRHAARIPQRHRGSDSFVPRRRTDRHDTASSPARPVERTDDCDRRT
jgi:integrase